MNAQIGEWFLRFNLKNTVNLCIYLVLFETEDPLNKIGKQRVLQVGPFKPPSLTWMTWVIDTPMISKGNKIKQSKT